MISFLKNANEATFSVGLLSFYFNFDQIISDKHVVSGAFQDRFWHSATEGTPRNAPKSYCQNFKHFSKFNKILLLTLDFVLPCLRKYFSIKVFMFKLPMLFSLLVFFTTWSHFCNNFFEKFKKNSSFMMRKCIFKGLWKQRKKLFETALLSIFRYMLFKIFFRFFLHNNRPNCFKWKYCRNLICFPQPTSYAIKYPPNH